MNFLGSTYDFFQTEKFSRLCINEHWKFVFPLLSHRALQDLLLPCWFIEKHIFADSSPDFVLLKSLETFKRMETLALTQVAGNSTFHFSVVTSFTNLLFWKNLVMVQNWMSAFSYLCHYPALGQNKYYTFKNIQFFGLSLKDSCRT